MFNGRLSTEFGLYIASLETGTKTATFGVERDIIEEKISKNPIPYFFGLEESPLCFELTMYREREWDYDTRFEVVRWLFQDEYKNFISSDNPSIIYNCIVYSRPEKILIGNIPRLITLKFRCDSPWAWSPVFKTIYDLSDNISTTVKDFENKSNVIKYYYPEIWIKSLDGGTISLINHSDNNREFKFDNLFANETIYINNQFKQIESDIPSKYRLADFNRNWLRLVYGVNKIGITGKCLIETKMQYPVAI